MIDPVRMGQVNPIASGLGGAAGVDFKSTQGSGPSTASDPRRTASASLPRLLDLVAQLTNSGPPVDEAKIAQVRRAIADGSYEIDADALAKAIVGHIAKD